MTNVSKNLLFAIAVLVGSTALSLGAFATTAHADDWGDGGSFDAGGWTDGGSYDSWSNGGSYDSGWDNGGSYDSWSNGGSYDSGWDNGGSYNGGTWEEYNPGSYETYNPGSYETYNPGSYETYNPGSYETYSSGDYETYNPGSYETYEQGYVQDYLDNYAQTSGYTTGSTGGYSIGGSTGGFSMPSFGSTGACTSCHYSIPSYPTPVCTTCNHPVPTPTPVCPAGTTGTYPNCHVIPVPTCTTCGGTNVTNVNNNTNTNTNTYVDNSINGSFNTSISNSGNTTVLHPVVPQQAIQYVSVPQYQQAPAPFCVITLQNAGAYNIQANLVWSSSNAQSGYISSIGTVAPNGSRLVTGYANQVFSMTVTGQGGSYTCQTQPVTPTYVPPVITPSVSLDQIPYTGLTMTPAEEAMYWLAILSIAAAGAYLAVYYKGGVMALATTAMNRRSNHFVVSEHETEEIAAPVTETAEEVQEEVSAPAANAFAFLPAMIETKTRDAMNMVRDASGMPKIVISRA